MSESPSKFPANPIVAQWKLFSLPVLALALCASNAFAQAPAVVIDAQQVVGSGYNSPQSIVVAKNGTVYIADTKNNQIVALKTNAPAPGTNTVVTTTGVTWSSPQSLALDANGDLFVGDTPSTGSTTYGRIIELTGDGTGNLTGAATLKFAGLPINDPIALAVDSANTLYIGDYPASGNGAIYSLPAGSYYPTAVNITGLSSQLTPASLLAVGTSLYIADNGNGTPGSLGGVYVAPAAGGAATKVNTQTFVINQPSGLAEDQGGNLYILSLLGLTGSPYNTGQQVLVLPAASPTTPYILPTTNLNTSTGMAFDPSSNLDVLELGVNDVTQLSALSPVNMGSIPVGNTTLGVHIPFNVELNAPNTLNTTAIFRVISQSDTASTEVTQATTGTCTSGKHTTLPGSGPTISAYYPYICQQAFFGTPEFPGIRTGAIQVKGSGATILASAAFYETGTAAVEVSYPLNATATAVNLQQPQAVAVSGLNHKVFVADTIAHAVYYTNGVAGTVLTQVSTGTIPLSGPSALAIDGVGNLFIGDFDLGDVIEVPMTNGGTPSLLNTGGLLQHPIAMAFDQAGNLYIGDAGPGGIFAGDSNPGYVVKVPAGGGAAFKMTIPAVPVVFPQALVADPYSAALIIGDGGDGTNPGQIVKVSANGSTASTVSVNDVTNPTGLAFDAADDLYVLDGTANTLTVVPPASSGVAQHLVQFNNTILASASALGISAGGQSFIIANIGAGSSNSLVYLNGNRTSFLFGGVQVGTPSQPETATEYNIGNSPLTLDSPFYTVNATNTAFSVLGSSTCANGAVIAQSNSCTINLQFTPSIVGSTSQIITVQSNAYNAGSSSGAPEISLQGHGTAASVVHKKTK